MFRQLINRFFGRTETPEDPQPVAAVVLSESQIRSDLEAVEYLRKINNIDSETGFGGKRNQRSWAEFVDRYLAFGLEGLGVDESQSNLTPYTVILDEDNRVIDAKFPNEKISLASGIV